MPTKVSNDPSYKKVDYTLRPAKNIERKMICDVLGRLSLYCDIQDYRYIGFGSIYFADFSLFHRRLGISDMVSIECDTEAEGRIRFNRPYECVDIFMGYSYEVLPKLKWDKRAIVWLDYDYELCKGILDDIDYLVPKLASGSIIMVTVDTESKRLRKPKSVQDFDPSEWPKHRRDQLRALVGEKYSPQNIKGKELGTEALGGVYRSIVNECVVESMKTKNLFSDVQYELRQIFNFEYSDGANMATYGWLVYEQAEQTGIDKCGILDHPFTSSAAEPLVIRAPMLTQKEMRDLDNHLPKAEVNTIETPVPNEDIVSYSQNYRMFPRFVEMEP